MGLPGRAVGSRANAVRHARTRHGLSSGRRTGGGARARSDYCKYAKAEAVGGEGRGRCRRGQGALTSPARHWRGSRLHVPRASPARSTSLRRARARAAGSRVRFFVPAYARPILTDGGRGPLAANRRRRFRLLPRPLGTRLGPPLFPAHVVSASGPRQIATRGPRRGHFLGRGLALPLALQAARACPSELLAGLWAVGTVRGAQPAPPSPCLPVGRPRR